MLGNVATHGLGHFLGRRGTYLFLEAVHLVSDQGQDAAVWRRPQGVHDSRPVICECGATRGRSRHGLDIGSHGDGEEAHWNAVLCWSCLWLSRNSSRIGRVASWAVVRVS
jgi:hypothetical protein